MADLIVYQSKYGATAEYAQWLGEALKTDAVEAGALKPMQLVNAGRIIIGTPVYLGKMLMRHWIAQHQGYLRNKEVYLFVVCGTPAADKDKTGKIVKENIPESIRDKFRIYFLPGRVMMEQLSWMDRFLIRVAIRAKKRASGETLTTGVNYVKKENLAALLATLDRMPVTPLRRSEAGKGFLL